VVAVAILGFSLALLRPALNDSRNRRSGEKKVLSGT